MSSKRLHEISEMQLEQYYWDLKPVNIKIIPAGDNEDIILKNGRLCGLSDKKVEVEFQKNDYILQIIISKNRVFDNKDNLIGVLNLAMRFNKFEARFRQRGTSFKEITVIPNIFK